MNKIIHVLSGDIWGGSEAQVYLLLNESLKHQESYIQEAVIFNKEYTLEKLNKAQITTHTLDESKGTFKLISEFFKKIGQIQPKIIVTHGYKEAFIGCLFKSFNPKTILVTVHHGSPEINPKSTLTILKSHIYNKGHQLISNYFADKIVSVSHEIKNKSKLSAAKTLIIQNCFEPNSLESQNDYFDTDGESFVILGRLEEVKRVDKAINACIETSSALYVVGEGSKESELKALVKSKNAEALIKFTGFSKNPSLYLKSCKALIICSNHEGMPTAILEAINHQCPIIATPITGVEQILNQFPGYPYFVSSNLSTAITNFKNSQQPHSWNKDEIKQFYPSQTLQKYTSLFSKLLKNQN